MNPQTQQTTPENTTAPAETPTALPPLPTDPSPAPPPQTPTAPVQYTDPLDMPQPAPLVQPVSVNPQQLTNASQARPSDHKKIKILGYSLIILTVLSAITSIAVNFASAGTAGIPQPDSSWITSVINVLIGIGILRYNKIALYAFLILNSLGMLIYVGTTLIFPWALLVLPFFLAYAAYTIWGFSVLLPKRVRASFH
jgi:hypothetical protein